MLIDKEARRASQRLDNKFSLILQEVRVSQQGVQILFAFLLTLPFQSRFDIVHGYQKWVYAVALLTATLSALLFIAPVSQHQILAGHGMKQTIVDAAYRTGQKALLFLLLSMLSALFLVTDVVFDIRMAFAFVVITICVAVVYWYVRPMLWRKLSSIIE